MGLGSRRDTRSEATPLMFCESCRYALNGLKPDEEGKVKCPECGTRQLKLHTAPLPHAWRCVGESLTLPVTVCVVVIVLILAGITPMYVLPYLTLAGVTVIGLPFITAMRILKRHRQHPGMNRAFLIVLFGGWGAGIALVFGLGFLAVALASI